MSSRRTRRSRCVSSASALSLLSRWSTSLSYSGPKRRCSRRRRWTAIRHTSRAATTMTATMMTTMVVVDMRIHLLSAEAPSDCPTSAASNSPPGSVPSAASRPERRWPPLQRSFFKSQGIAIELPVQQAETERVLPGQVGPDTDVPHGVARHHGIVVIAERPLHLLHAPADSPGLLADRRPGRLCCVAAVLDGLSRACETGQDQLGTAGGPTTVAGSLACERGPWLLFVNWAITTQRTRLQTGRG